MLRLRACAVFALCAFGAIPAFAQSFAPANGADHSAFRDTSNISGAELNYRASLTTANDGIDRYLNSIVLNKDSNWDPNLTLEAAGSSFVYNDLNNGFQQGTYTLGTAIAPDSDWLFDAATRFGSVDSSVADGVYNATLEFYGGEDESATDLLSSFDIPLEVFEKLDLAVDVAASPDTLFAGETTQFTMTVMNNMTGKNFVSTTWFLSGMSDGSNSLAWQTFDGDWFA